MSDELEKARLEGRILGSYEVGRCLGSGAMGEVYEARHRTLHKRVAIKTLAPAMGKGDAIIARFVREGRAAARIRHPNVVDITDVEVEGDTPYLVMEFLEGSDLSDVLKERQLDVEEALDIMLPVLSAVATAHTEQVIHRDLKPANIFITQSRTKRMVEPKVVDFGISKLTDGSDAGLDLTKSETVLGTPYYMSPEQARGALKANAFSDQYSLAVILYECLTRTLPFVGDTLLQLIHRIVQGEFAAPRTLRPDLPQGLEDAIVKAMHKDAAGRFPDVAAFGMALLPFASERTAHQWRHAFESATEFAQTLAPTPSQAPISIESTDSPDAQASTLAAVESEPKRRKSSGLILLAAAVGLGVVGIGGWIVASSEPEPEPVVEPEVEAPRTFVARVSVEPRNATIRLDGEVVGTGSFTTEMVADGEWHAIVASAEGYQTATVSFRDAPPEQEITLEPNEPEIVTELVVGEEGDDEDKDREATMSMRSRSEIRMDRRERFQMRIQRIAMGMRDSEMSMAQVGANMAPIIQ